MKGSKLLSVNLLESIQELIACNKLTANTPAHQAAKQVYHQGYDSLSPKQKNLFDIIIVSQLRKLQKDRQMQALVW